MNPKRELCGKVRDAEFSDQLEGTPSKEAQRGIKLTSSEFVHHRALSVGKERTRGQGKSLSSNGRPG